MTEGRLDAWTLTGLISPRRVVRAAAIDTSGHPINAYPLVHPVTGLEPRTPWAVHLADRAGRYRLLCADLDAKPAAAAAADADRLSTLLQDLGITHLVCASGPSGGRHVWIGLRDGLDAVVVGALARLLKAWLPTLDLAPLTNPVSGCARPPGSPHRLGGTSQVIAGTLDALTHPATTNTQIDTLLARLADHAAPPPARDHEWRRPVGESGGLPYLIGQKRPLSATARALMDNAPVGDLSAVLWRVLCAAAAAHWRFPDLAAVADAPGLEHARTLNSSGTRAPRPSTGSASATAVLRRQWTRAVHTVANLEPDPAHAGDETFDTRAELVSAIIQHVQARADASAGRWGASRAGLAQRRVLDALCLFHLQAVRTQNVEADIRRLGLTCGLDRETARRALLALARDGWIHRTHPAAGRRAARWTIDPTGTIHTQISGTLSQADPRPTGTGNALRATLTRELDERLTASRHDAFAPTGGLGLSAGTLYGRLTQPAELIQAGHLSGASPDQTARTLDQLAEHGLIEYQGGFWQRTTPDRLEQAADSLTTSGHGQRRAERYAVERALWAWWCTELDALRAAHHHRRTAWPGRWFHRAHAWPAHPRRIDGRASFAAARRALSTGQCLSQAGVHSVERRHDVFERT